MLILFYIFAIISVVSAILVISARNPIHCAISLVVALFNIAGIFVLLDATFLAAMQVLVYAGAIMVLFIFVIMLLNLNQDELHESNSPLIFRLLVGICTLSAFAMSAAFIRVPLGFMPLRNLQFGSVLEVAKLLFTKYLIPFEMTSLLLTVAIIGAIILAKRSLKLS